MTSDDTENAGPEFEGCSLFFCLLAVYVIRLLTKIRLATSRRSYSKDVSMSNTYFTKRHVHDRARYLVTVGCSGPTVAGRSAR